MEKRIAVGIDLGTSNSALAFAPAREGGAIEVLPVTQLLSFQAVGELDVLPSALYLLLENEAAGASARLPWQGELLDGVVGQFAREHGALVPNRLVTSAKSWLSNPHVGPEKPVLPWQSDLGERKVSAFEASRRYLEHLRHALRWTLRQRGEEAGTHEGGNGDWEVVVTVPASFDEVARLQTHRAAAAAGWGEVTLLEEQQAAFYHWIEHAGDGWRRQVHPGDVVLVCDVGGGTADFSLVAVSEQDGDLALERVSVGDHLLLGGDNMDLALAYTLRADMETRGQTIDAVQFLSLVHSCRVGKETLFADPTLARVPLAIPSRGSSLFGGTLATALTRETLDAVVLAGFFPLTGIEDQPARRRAAGLTEFGLDYAADPALTKHLASFLARSWQNTRSSEGLTTLVADRGRESGGVRFVCPTAVLFNGGVFKADPLRERLLALLRQWNGDTPVRELAGSHFDLAVAKGGAAYARNLVNGRGIRIKAGTARSYYVGLETSMPAVPGFTPPLKAVCVVPQAMEEGTEAGLPGREFGLVTGEQVEFRFFSSSVRAGDAVGTVVGAEDDLEETASLEVTLPPLEGRSGELLPVALHSVITELGTLELWMRHEATGQQWKLEFNVRGQ